MFIARGVSALEHQVAQGTPQDGMNKREVCDVCSQYLGAYNAVRPD